LITVRGGRFVLEGRELVPNGVNSYPLLQHAGEQRWDAIDDIFAQARALGRPLLRTNAFMDGGQHPARLRNDDGSLREAGFAALDALLARAAHCGVRLLLVLTNNWSDHGGAPAVVRMIAPPPDKALGKDAFWNDRRALELQRAFIRALVGRYNRTSGIAYRDDPTIFAWELVNEARCSSTVDTLTSWARAMASAVRAAGARQPIAWGGSGHRGKHGEDLAAIAADDAVEILTLHLYPQLPERWAARAPRTLRVSAACVLGAATLLDRVVLARRHGLPLLLEELGYLPPAHVTGAARDSERAEVLRCLLALASEHGVATFPWMIGERGRNDYDGHLLRPEHAQTIAAVRCI
jgi:endo-1,4-beta-mannosidase